MVNRPRTELNGDVEKFCGDEIDQLENLIDGLKITTPDVILSA